MFKKHVKHTKYKKCEGKLIILNGQNDISFSHILVSLFRFKLLISMQNAYFPILPVATFSSFLCTQTNGIYTILVKINKTARLLMLLNWKKLLKHEK